jgi:hypothetical protein
VIIFYLREKYISTPPESYIKESVTKEKRLARESNVSCVPEFPKFYEQKGQEGFAQTPQ